MGTEASQITPSRQHVRAHHRYTSCLQPCLELLVLRILPSRQQREELEAGRNVFQ